MNPIRGAATLLAVASISLGIIIAQVANHADDGAWGWAAAYAILTAIGAWMMRDIHRECVTHETAAALGLPIMARLSNDDERPLTVTVRRTRSGNGHVTYTIHTTTTS